VEEAAVSTLVGSSELGRWGNGGAAESEDRRRSGPVGARSGAGERERRAVSGAGCFGVLGVPFIAAGEDRRGVAGPVMAGFKAINSIEGGGEVKRV
jgi:hypothetical protein